MLGRFLEFSLSTPDIRASLDFYTRLGFSQAEVGGARAHPYAVVTDGRICLGLHEAAMIGPSITFVKPDLLKALQTLEEFELDFEFRHLGNDVFNEVGWFDPAGQLVRLIEARTFSPSKRRGTELSRCGYFLEIALPALDLDASKNYWERFGFVGIEDSDERVPHVSCISDNIDLGLYHRSQLERAALRFDVDDVRGTLARLTEIGVATLSKMPSPLRHIPGAVVIAPEGTPILLSSAA